MNLLGETDRLLRAAAYDILNRRDRLSGWKLHRKAFLKSTRMDAATLSAHAEHNLRRIVTHAYKTSPYYAAAWDAAAFRPTDSFRFEDLSRLPFLTKEIVKKEKTALVSRAFDPAELDLSYTGGTTGTQTSFYVDHDCAVARMGRQWGMFELFGYRPGMRRALVWGVHEDLPDPDRRNTLKQWFRRYASSQEALDCTVMRADEMRKYHARLMRFRPQVMYGYPSALTELGRFIEDERLEPIRVGTIVTTAERLSDANRSEMRRLFGGEVFTLYGTREYGCIGFECARHAGYHIDTGSVALEIVNDGRAARPGDAGEIVITDLLNYGMPFVRSRTGDMGALSPEPCACGSALPLLRSLDGRMSDVVYRPDGSLVPGLMITDVFHELPSIRYLQFVQDRMDELEVRLVVVGEFPEAMHAQVVREVRDIIGQEIAVRIRLVDEIERNPRSGKIQEVVCNVNRRRAPIPQETDR
jgi:phenylacetate-CoA ligase